MKPKLFKEVKSVRVSNTGNTFRDKKGQAEHFSQKYVNSFWRCELGLQDNALNASK
jgi:hypothetical protein